VCVQARILVTHGIGFLPQCGHVTSMDGGEVIEEGTYDELMANNGLFAEFIHVYSNTEEDNEEDDPSMCVSIAKRSPQEHVLCIVYTGEGMKWVWSLSMTPLFIALMEYSEFDEEDEQEVGLTGDTIENNNAIEVRRHKLQRMK